MPTVGTIRLDDGTNTEDIDYYFLSTRHTRERVDLYIRKWNFTTSAWQYSRTGNTRYAFTGGSSNTTFTIVAGVGEKNRIVSRFLQAKAVTVQYKIKVSTNDEKTATALTKKIMIMLLFTKELMVILVLKLLILFYLHWHMLSNRQLILILRAKFNKPLKRCQKLKDLIRL